MTAQTDQPSHYNRTFGNKIHAMTSKGEYRVGITFNPSADPIVDQIKRAAADLIDLCEKIDGQDNPERGRLKALAQTAIEDGAMWAVKAATKAQAPSAFDKPVPAADDEDDIFRSTIMKALDQFESDGQPIALFIDQGEPSGPALDACIVALRREGFVGINEMEVATLISEYMAT